jgi:hypothetical protein
MTLGGYTRLDLLPIDGARVLTEAVRFLEDCMGLEKTEPLLRLATEGGEAPYLLFLRLTISKLKSSSNSEIASIALCETFWLLDLYLDPEIDLRSGRLGSLAYEVICLVDKAFYICSRRYESLVNVFCFPSELRESLRELGSVLLLV